MSLFPPKISDGATIGIVGPASPMITERLEKGITYLRDRGYQIKIGKHVHDVHGYFAGTDAHRIEDLNEMLRDPEIHAVFCTRGGYGTPRLLPQVDYEAMRRFPKPLVGYSDITALQLAIYARTGVVTFSGPMVAVEFGKGIETFTEANFWPLVTTDVENLMLRNRDKPLGVMRAGTARGSLLGGNLAMVCSLLGSRYSPDFTGAILVLEEIGEEPYRIDRMLTQLKLAGVFDKLGGLVLARFTGCEPTSDDPFLSLETAVHEITSGFDFPILTDLPYGHIDLKYTLPIGAEARLDSNLGVLELLPGATPEAV